MVLDGHSYPVLAAAHRPHEEKPGQTRTTITNRVDRTEGAATFRSWGYTLQVSYAQLQALRASFRRGGALDLIDAEGVTYEVAAGTDTQEHKYGCGVYFEELGDPVNLTPLLATTTYHVEVKLTAARAI